jgi:hypothetical protein
MMRRVSSWTVGLLLGAIAGAGVLIGGVLALLLLFQTGLWAARERARPAGLGGLMVGIGTSSLSLLVAANARCAASNSSTIDAASGCVAPDVTWHLAAAAVAVTLGTAASLVAFLRASRGSVS